MFRMIFELDLVRNKHKHTNRVYQLVNRWYKLEGKRQGLWSRDGKAAKRITNIQRKIQRTISKTIAPEVGNKFTWKMRNTIWNHTNKDYPLKQATIVVYPE